uniref:Uncharacterized protein n=1 Tax=Sparus aurata TaxID=8175 RepID=A0A671TWT0_SPAAU
CFSCWSSHLNLSRSCQFLPNTSRQHISLDRDWVGCSKYIYKKKKTSSANNAKTAHPCLSPFTLILAVGLSNNV